MLRMASSPSMNAPPLIHCSYFIPAALNITVTELSWFQDLLHEQTEYKPEINTHLLGSF
jgi:hypothetical protein